MVELHDRLIARWGGTPSVRDASVLDSCLAQPQTAVFGVERYASAEEKAAAYCFFMICNHSSFDGNKRIGFLAALHFLRLNAVETLFDESEAFDVITRVATSAPALKELVSLVRRAVDRGRQKSG